jgi:hypothetical protein
MLVLKQKVLILIEQVIDIHAVVVLIYVFDQELFLQELRYQEHGEDARETEEWHIPFEEESMVEKVVGQVEGHVEHTEP